MNSFLAGVSRCEAVQLLKKVPLSVGILAGSWMNLAEHLSVLDDLDSPMLHLDIMDGHFCPQFTVGPWAIKQLPNSFIKDVHLMVNNALPVVQACVEAGAHIVTIQPENEIHSHHILSWLRTQTSSVVGGEMPVLRGISLCPATPLESIIPLLDEVEIVQLLTVNPGFGSKVDPNLFIKRFDNLLSLLGSTRTDKMIVVDGSLTLDMASEVKKRGADRVVSGSALFANDQLALNTQNWLKHISTE